MNSTIISTSYLTPFGDTVYEIMQEKIEQDFTSMESNGDALLDRVKQTMSDWFMMSSIYPVIGLTIVYLIFITYLGPIIMKSRKPFDLTGILLAYNGTQVIFSTWWLIKMVTNWEAMAYVYRSTFQPELHIVNENIENQLDSLGYYYLMSKYFELLDTVFFVLRKKTSQVTFLHIYHHTNMAVSTWYYVKHIWGRHIIVLGIVNIFIHIIMYTYYLLSALGPSIRPYLWWKKYITRMQMGQFLIVLSYVGVLTIKNSAAQKPFIIFTACNTSSFLILFANFYQKAYMEQDRNKLQKNEEYTNGHVKHE